MRIIGPIVIAAVAGFSGVYAFMAPEQTAATARSLLNRAATCNIKGNVSIDSGERIYHVPGQTYYVDTNVDARYGERWFCSEQEARDAGWRRSRV